MKLLKIEREALTELRTLYNSIEVLKRNRKNHLVIMVDGRIKTTLPSTTRNRFWFRRKVSEIDRLLR